MDSHGMSESLEATMSGSDDGSTLIPREEQDPLLYGSAMPPGYHHKAFVSS